MKKYLIISVALIILLLFTDCSRRRRETGESNSRTRTEQKAATRSSRGKSVVRMKPENGVYYVPCKINGTEMQFIFDTGASDITMSAVEARYLYKQGKLTDDDILGTQQYQIADGSIAEGTVVNLRTVTIGNRTLNNVQASIVHNLEAPLLLGQSALAEFGKISIDYNKHEITFE
jgi:aspartyl protease family protein